MGSTKDPFENENERLGAQHYRDRRDLTHALTQNVTLKALLALSVIVHVVALFLWVVSQ